MWNYHIIYKQLKQSNVVTEKSYMLYYWLQILEIKKMSLKSDSELLCQLKKNIAAYDMFLFL